jgi:myo-inositol-1(or 4)-monophosphatase
MADPVSAALPAGLLELALATAREAAGLVAQRRAAGVTVAATKSSVVDVVTEADRASEELIRSRLLAARPDDGFVGEEGSSDTGTSGIRWVVDPIDGTVNFLYGIPAYAVSIAAQLLPGAAAGPVPETVAAVVLDVAHGTAYTATPGGGAFRDGVRLSVRAPAPMGERLVLTGFNYSAETRRVQAAAVGRMLPQVRDIRRQGSCALDLCHVAEGAADAYVEEGVSDWDHAAGALVATEAGAVVELATGAGGKDTVICAPAHGFAAFRTLVVDCGFLSTSSGIVHPR